MATKSRSVTTTPPTLDVDLRINGLSLAFYDFYLIKTSTHIATDTLPLAKLDSPYHYDLLFDYSEEEREAHAIFYYTQPLAITPLQLPHAGIVKGIARLMFQVVGRQFLLATTIINVDRLGHIIDGTKLHVDRPLHVDDVLTLVSELNQSGGSLFPFLQGQKERAVTACFGQFTVPVNVNQSRKNIAFQIWDIDNLSLELTASSHINGIELAFRFAWEIAALLECNSDLVRIHHAWRDRRVDQIGKLLQQGSDVLADHRVLTNRSVSLEISQVTHPTLTVRSAQRLAVFGYDSTSIYLWSYLALQEFVLGHYNKYLTNVLQQMSDPKELPYAEKPGISSTYKAERTMLGNLVDIKTAIYHALDSVCWITEEMKERRHAKFFADSVRARGFDNLQLEVDRKLHELTSIATDVHQVLLALDQRDIMADLRSVSQAANYTRRSISLLNFAVAAAQAVVLSEYLSNLIPILDKPLWKGILGLGLFVLTLLLYIALSRNVDSKHAKRR